MAGWLQIQGRDVDIWDTNKNAGQNAELSNFCALT